MENIIRLDILRLEKRIAQEEARLQCVTNLGQERKRLMYTGSIYKKHELLNKLKKEDSTTLVASDIYGYHGLPLEV